MRVEVVKWFEQCEPNGRTGREKDWVWVLRDEETGEETGEVGFWDVLGE